MEAWLLERSREPRPIYELLMFVLDEQRAVRGFLELVLDARGFRWSGNILPTA